MMEFVKCTDEQSDSLSTQTLADLTDLDVILDPALIPRQYLLFPDLEELPENVDFLSKRIQRNPRRLREHVQRIMLHRKRRESRDTFDAMTDLFLVLGESGQELRRNLLKKTRKILTAKQYIFLRYHLRKALTLDALQSFLVDNADHRQRRSELVQDRFLNGSGEATTLERARFYLRNDDLSNAQILLETALTEDPGDPQIVEALLSFYVDNQLASAFFHTYYSNLGRGLANAALWRQTEHLFRTATEPADKQPDDLAGYHLSMADYKLIDEVYLLPTTAGAYFAVAAADAEHPMRRLLLNLLKRRESLRINQQNVVELLDMDNEQEALRLLHKAQSMKLIQGFERAAAADRVRDRQGNQ